MRHIKKILLVIFGIGIALAANSPSQATTDPAIIISNLRSQVAATPGPIPPIVSPTTTPDGYTYRMDNVVVWDGHAAPKSTAYEIYITRPDGSTLATGTAGGLAGVASHDWQAASTISPSSTSTP